MNSQQLLFQRYIGIDYSGAEVPESRLKGLRVYMADRAHSATEVLTTVPHHKYWTREGIAKWLVARLMDDVGTVIGIDHGFSFPLKYFERHKLPLQWPVFLDDFQKHWPTDAPHTYVDFVRDNNPRSGDSRWRRVCETRCKAKSVFHFDVTGSVAKSTHAGIPWLRYVRNNARGRVHFWPFDGWQIPEGQSVIAEIYPSLWKNDFPTEDRDPHQHDAFSVAETLRLADIKGDLQSWFEPKLNERDLKSASIEGWILGLPCTSPVDFRVAACPFCARTDSNLVMARNELAVAFPDSFPVSEGHTLIVPQRHEAEFFKLTDAEQKAMLSLARSVQRRLQRIYSPDGYNLGINVGQAGGQTVSHAHLHIIPRYSGDVPDARGGVRWVIPSKARYWSPENSK